MTKTRKKSSSTRRSPGSSKRTRSRGAATTRTRSRGRDRALVSDEPYEVEYIHRKFPNHTHRQVVAAIQSCKKDLKGSEDRRKIMTCVRGKLGK